MGAIFSSFYTQPPPKKVFFFDIDNCLYPKSAQVHERMTELVHAYVGNLLGLPADEAARIGDQYYRNYGLAISGLVMHHGVDPLEYNSKVDDTLPMEELIKYRPELVEMIRAVDRSQVKLWLFTNAYQNHARRVVKILGLEGMFDGLTYCDYEAVPFMCKPQERMFAKAMADAGVERMEDCYFVDDSFNNCATAERLGWHAVHLKEDGINHSEKQACKHQVEHLTELRSVFPQFFTKG